MTDEELAVIRARCDAADAGPWQAYSLGREVWAVPDNRLLVEDCYTAENATFIAAARSDVPALLDEIASLRVQNDYLRSELGLPAE